MATHHEPTETNERRVGSAGAAARVYWMMFGNLFLLLNAVGIAHVERMTWRDTTFWAIAFSIALVRALDTMRLGGLTADGRPSTSRDVVRHTAILMSSAVVLWWLAKVLSSILS